MKFKLTAMLVVAASFLQACTSTYDLTSRSQENHPWLEQQYRTYPDFLSEAKGKTVRIVLRSGQEFLGTISRADADSIGWIGGKEIITEDWDTWMYPADGDGAARRDSTEFRARVVPTSRVQSLEVTHHYHLWWLGSLVGLLGTTIPALASGAWEPDVVNSGKDYGGRTDVILVGFGGALVGGLATGFLYHSDQFLTDTSGSADTTNPRSHN